MNWPILIFIVLLLFILMGIGTFISVALGLTGIVVLLLFSGGKAILTGALAWTTTHSSVLTTVPLFLLMGEILLFAGVTQKVYRGISVLVRKVPGGLLISNVAASAMFAAMCGVSVASAAAIGSIAIPEELKAGYNRRWVFGSIAAGGTLAILIPPSVNMIIYSTLVGESVGQLFAGGVIPGIILTLLFMSLIFVAAGRNRSIAPRDAGEPLTWDILVGLLGPAFIILVVLGGIFLGLATPTEAAALGVWGALILALVYRSVSFRVLRDSLFTTVKATSMIMFIVVGATILAFALTDQGVPGALANFVTSLHANRYVIMAGIWLLYIILGCFFDPLSMMIMTLPVVFPVVTALGFNSVWLGIILVILCEIGMITPPVGMTLFVVQGIEKSASLSEVSWGSLPFVVAGVFLLVLLTVFPSLVLWLPSIIIPVR